MQPPPLYTPPRQGIMKRAVVDCKANVEETLCIQMYILLYVRCKSKFCVEIHLILCQYWQYTENQKKKNHQKKTINDYSVNYESSSAINDFFVAQLYLLRLEVENIIFTDNFCNDFAQREGSQILSLWGNDPKVRGIYYGQPAKFPSTSVHKKLVKVATFFIGVYPSDFKGTLCKISIFYGEVNGTTMNQQIVLCMRFGPF